MSRKKSDSFQYTYKLACVTCEYSECLILFNRKECDTVAADLSKAGIQAVSYHAGLGDNDRIAIQEKWLNGYRCKVRP